MIYSSQDIEQNKLKLIILGHLLPFYPSKNPKNQNFEKWKNFLEISFYTCTKNHNHVMYSSWDTEWDKNNPKNKDFEKMKKLPSDIIILHRCNINDNHMGSWDMEHDRHNFLSFWTVFCPFSPLWTQKIKILKNWK